LEQQSMPDVKLGNDIRELVAALLHAQDPLADTGAADIKLAGGRRNMPNRHVARAQSNAKFPSRSDYYAPY